MQVMMLKLLQLSILVLIGLMFVVSIFAGFQKMKSNQQVKIINAIYLLNIRYRQLCNQLNSEDWCYLRSIYSEIEDQTLQMKLLILEEDYQLLNKLLNDFEKRIICLQEKTKSTVEVKSCNLVIKQINQDIEVQEQALISFRKKVKHNLDQYHINRSSHA